jgi:MORC family CW-type zinc finger protein
MVHYSADRKTLLNGDEGKESLEVITAFSPLKTEKEIFKHFKAIEPSGTRIIIWNLRYELKEGEESQKMCEFDFSDPIDIRIRDFAKKDLDSKFLKYREKEMNKLDTSLRAYCTVLYLEPRMKIYIRGHKVIPKLIARSLAKTKIDSYTPQKKGSPVQITFGLNTIDKQSYGMLIYHKGRLIKPFLRVGIQLQNSRAGTGVVGVINASFLQPTHNKQDFDQTRGYQLCINALATRLATYWADLKQGTSLDEVLDIVNEDDEVVPDVTWVLSFFFSFLFFFPFSFFFFLFSYKFPHSIFLCVYER